jgi:peptide/nickel transport system substrate-binding protein
MKKWFPGCLLVVLLVSIVVGACTPTPTSTPPTSKPPTTAAPTTAAPVAGGAMIMAGNQLPKNIGYLPEMPLLDRYGIFATMAERLMNVKSDGELVPELATSVEADANAKTITWKIRQGVKFHDGTPLNAEAVRWNFQQLKDAGVLQFGDAISAMEMPDAYTFRLVLKNFAYVYMYSFSFNNFILSPTGLSANPKAWAYTHIAATGPFKLQDFQPDNRVLVVKNTDYWRTGKPYLDSIELKFNLDSAVLSASMQSKEIQMDTSGDLVHQKDMVNKGFKSVLTTPNQTVYFFTPDSGNASSALSNPLVRQAVEYAIDRPAICNGLLGGTSKPMNQMSYPGAVGYDAQGGRNFDPAKAKQLLEQAGYTGGKTVNIQLIGSNTAPSIAWRTAIVDYLKQVGITATVVPLPFATFATQQATGWKDGFMNCVENSAAIWSIGYLAWLGPLPTSNPIPSLGRSKEYNDLAAQVLTAKDAKTTNDIVTQLIKKNNGDATTLPLWANPATWVCQPFLHVENAEGGPRTFDWANIWMEKK